MISNGGILIELGHLGNGKRCIGTRTYREMIETSYLWRFPPRGLGEWTPSIILAGKNQRPLGPQPRGSPHSLEGSECGRWWTPGFCVFNSHGKNLVKKYCIDLVERNPKIQTPSQSGNFPRRYECFWNWSGLKFSGASYLDLRISRSCEPKAH